MSTKNKSEQLNRWKSFVRGREEQVLASRRMRGYSSTLISQLMIEGRLIVKEIPWNRIRALFCASNLRRTSYISCHKEQEEILSVIRCSTWEECWWTAADIEFAIKMPPHPNLLVMHNYGVCQEHVWGETEFSVASMDDLRRSGKMTVPILIKGFREIGAAIQHVHKNGRTHCDVSLQNMAFVEVPGSGYVCKLGDHELNKNGTFGNASWGTMRYANKKITGSYKPTLPGWEAYFNGPQDHGTWVHSEIDPCALAKCMLDMVDKIDLAKTPTDEHRFKSSDHHMSIILRAAFQLFKFDSEALSRALVILGEFDCSVLTPADYEPLMNFMENTNMAMFGTRRKMKSVVPSMYELKERIDVLEEDLKGTPCETFIIDEIVSSCERQKIPVNVENAKSAIKIMMEAREVAYGEQVKKAKSKIQAEEAENIKFHVEYLETAQAMKDEEYNEFNFLRSQPDVIRWSPAKLIETAKPVTRRGNVTEHADGPAPDVATSAELRAQREPKPCPPPVTENLRSPSIGESTKGRSTKSGSQKGRSSAQKPNGAKATTGKENQAPGYLAVNQKLNLVSLPDQRQTKTKKSSDHLESRPINHATADDTHKPPPTTKSRGGQKKLKHEEEGVKKVVADIHLFDDVTGADYATATAEKITNSAGRVHQNYTSAVFSIVHGLLLRDAPTMEALRKASSRNDLSMRGLCSVASMNKRRETIGDYGPDDFVKI